MHKNDKMYFYDSFADEFDKKMNKYDLNKRLMVVFDELLTDSIYGKKLLDAGSGTGWFSKYAEEKGALVTSIDVGENLLNKVAEKCKSTCIKGSILEMPFPDNSFDFIVSSEVIEHTPDPLLAFDELYRVLKPGGKLILTTPNKLWYFAIYIANKLKIRPYDGYENWISWREMNKKVIKTGFVIESRMGIHMFPFLHPFVYPILDYFHSYNRFLRPFMLNMAIKCRK
jgi:2-polyprenyl-3-methyl-5-hydroxy-6-metoxy-1,4-benzoquinol methylase